MIHLALVEFGLLVRWVERGGWRKRLSCVRSSWITFGMLAIVHCHKGVFEAIHQRARIAHPAGLWKLLSASVASTRYHFIWHLEGRVGRLALVSSGRSSGGATELRQALVTYSFYSDRAFIPFFQGLLAEFRILNFGEQSLEKWNKCLFPWPEYVTNACRSSVAPA